MSDGRKLKFGQIELAGDGQTPATGSASAPISARCDEKTTMGLRLQGERPYAECTMLPIFKDVAIVRLIRGELDHQFSMTAANMLMFNLRRTYQQDPTKLSELVDEARRFFEKFHKALGPDLETLLHKS